MSWNHLEKIALGISGVTAVVIGAGILAAPHAFFASYGITIGDDPSLLSELRAPAAGLAAFGILMLLGIWHTVMMPISKAVALTVFLAFPAGRLIGVIVDGLPSGPILGALAFEVAVATLWIVVLSRRSKPMRAFFSDNRFAH